jgi:photosystem II stability/assembly factor-like uncharacterized protein
VEPAWPAGGSPGGGPCCGAHDIYRPWQPQWQGAGDPLTLSATDPAHAWALIACPGSGASCGRTLIGTTDAGLRWRVIARLPAAVNQVQFFSDRLGVATSDRCLAAAGPPGSPSLAWASVFDQLSCAMHGCATAFLLHSEDGGQSWKQVTLADNNPDQCGPGNIAFSAAPDGST